MKNPVTRTLFRIVLPYLLIAALWILVSDWLMERLVSNSSARALWSIYKGWAFVLVTAILLFALLRAELRARERMEEELRRSEADLTEAQRVARLGSWSLDLSTNAVRWSKGLYGVFGFEEGTFGNSYASFLNCVHPDDRPRVVQSNAQARASGAPFELEYRVITRAGQLKTIREVGYAVKDATGKVAGLFGTAQDITERKQAEQALRESEERLRLLDDNLPDCYVYQYLQEPDGSPRFLYLSAGVERLHGVKAEVALRDALMLRRQIAPEQLPALATAEAASLLDLSDFHMELRIQRADGQWRWVQLRSRPRQTSSGQVIWDGVATNITERKQAEEAARESQQLLDLVLATLPVGVAVIDRAGNIVLANAASKRIWGDTIVSGTERWAQTRAFWHDSGKRIATGNWASARALFKGETSLNECIDIETYDGQRKTILNSAAPIRNPEGAIVGAVFVNEDVTERVRAEETLHQLSGQLLRLQDEERRRLARELHDTTAQKLAVLLFALQRLAAQASSLDAGVQDSLAECQALATQCADELRTVSYLLHPPLLEELGLAGAVRDYADGFAQRSGLRVDLEVLPGLERLPGEKELALFRVMQESLANVHRHSGSKTVSIRLTQLNGEIRLEVQDAGCGLELKNGPGSGEKEPSKLGVGIAGMRERLRQLGGRLEFESDHRGTTVRASLPLDQPKSEHADDKNPDCG